MTGIASPIQLAAVLATYRNGGAIANVNLTNPIQVANQTAYGQTGSVSQVPAYPSSYYAQPQFQGASDPTQYSSLAGTSTTVANANIQGSINTPYGPVPGGSADIANALNSAAANAASGAPNLPIPAAVSSVLPSSFSPTSLSQTVAGALGQGSSNLTSVAQSATSFISGQNAPGNIANPAAATGVTTAMSRIYSDPRVILAPYSSFAQQVFGLMDSGNQATPIMQPLFLLGGLLFPYQPSITFDHRANYDSLELTHSIQTFFFYKNAPSLEFAITGTFTAQTTSEAAYMLGVMHFCKTIVKMNFGVNSSQPGLPPPLFLLSGFGPLILNLIPVVIKGASYAYTPDIETVPVLLQSGTQLTENQVPTKMDVTINVAVQKTPTELTNNFSIDAFRSGRLLTQGVSNGGGGVTGFGGRTRGGGTTVTGWI